MWLRGWKRSNAAAAAAAVMVVAVVAQGLIPSEAAASIPTRSASLPLPAGGSALRAADPDLSNSCEIGGARIPGLGSAPSSSLLCPGRVVAEEAADPCLLPGLPDLCPGVTSFAGPPPPGLGSPSDPDDVDPGPSSDGASPPDMGGWATVPSPNASAEENILTGVTCVTSSDCWAVGRSSSGLALTLTMRWDGTSWEAVPSPNIPSARAHILSDVICVDGSECWAVGSYITAAFRVRTLILGWDGASWEVVTSPDVGAAPWNGLESVTCASASECWAVGFDTSGTAARTLILRWDGSAWAVHDSPNAGTEANVLHGVACASTSDCWAVGSFTSDAGSRQALTLLWDGSAWELRDSAAEITGTAENVLSSVACLSTSDCWAVGHMDNGTQSQTLIVRWDGTSWATVISPNAPGPLNTYLSRVTCASATQCWAVGHSNDDITIDQHFIARWDGTVWTPATLPDPLETRESVLGGVACPSPSDCWGVGSLGSGGTAHSLLTRWDGTSWGTVPSPKISLPEESHGYLHDVTCVSATDCWAVGFYFSGNVARSLTMHWDGTSWGIVTSPNTAYNRNNYLAAVTCTSTSACWAVGRHTTTSDTERQPLILRWDGASWSIVSPSPADTSAVLSDALTAISCASASECMAVGHSNFDGNRYLAFAMRWDGTLWTRVPVPLREDAEDFAVPSDLLYGVACPAPSSCWAAGAHWSGTMYRTLVAHWDGVSWTPGASPNIAPEGGNILSAVSCVSSTNCWAVGSADDYEQALIEHWDGSSWSIVPSPQTGSLLSAVTCVSASDCWAAGPYYSPDPPARTLLVRWDGTSWTKAASPNSSPADSNHLAGIACASSSECWAVGRHMAAGRPQTLTLRYAPGGTSLPEITDVAFTESSASTGQYTDEVLLEARLVDSNGDAIGGESLAFALTGEDGSYELDGTTDESGVASVTLTLEAEPGPYQLSIRYPGDEERAASQSSTDFEITREDSDLELSVEGRGNNMSIAARLSDQDSPSAGIGDRSIDFYSDGELIGSAETDAGGVASVPIPPGHRGSNRTYEGVFAGDDFFLSSSAARPGHAGGDNVEEGARQPAGVPPRRLLTL